MRAIAWGSLYFALCVCVGAWAVRDDSLGLLSLDGLTSFVTPVVSWGNWYALSAQKRIWQVAGILTALFLLLSWGLYGRSKLLAGSFIASVWGLVCLVTGEIAIGGGLLVGASILVVSSFRRGEIFFPSRGSSQSFEGSDYLWITICVVCAIFFRSYAINQNLDIFEGELAPYSAAGTSVKGWFIANKGLYGPWAPLGILYYVPIYLTTELYGVTLTTLRLSSMFVGVLTVPIFYLFLHAWAGRGVAFGGAFLLALNQLHIGWGRTDIHPHGVTLWPAALLAYGFLRALRGDGARYWWYTVFAMALTWHQYPSGQSAAAIPFFTLAILFFVRAWPRTMNLRVGALLCLGAVLWFAGLPLSYLPADWDFHIANPFTLTTQRTSWGNTSEEMGFMGSVLFVLSKVLEHSWDVIEGIFYKAPYLFNQDIVPETPGFPIRTVPWVIAACAVPGIVVLARSLRTPEGALFAAWLVVAMIPGVGSERAFPKRLSTFYPLFEVLAVIGVVHLHRALGAPFKKVLISGVAAFCLAYSVYTGSLWFSGRQWRNGVPGEVRVASVMTEWLQPRTIVFVDAWKDYLEGKLTYLMLDPLSDPMRRPAAWLARWPHQDFINGSKALEEMASFVGVPQWSITWNKLRYLVPETSSHRSWEYGLFVFQDREIDRIQQQPVIAEIRSRCRDERTMSFTRDDRLSEPVFLLRCRLPLEPKR